MRRSLLAVALLAAAVLPARAADRLPAAAVVYGTPVAAPVAFEPRERVQQTAGRELAAVIVVRGIAAEGPVPQASTAPDADVLRALAALCRSDPRDAGPLAAGHPALPAGF